jgi:hypothetical protein
MALVSDADIADARALLAGHAAGKATPDADLWQAKRSTSKWVGGWGWARGAAPIIVRRKRVFNLELRGGSG